MYFAHIDTAEIAVQDELRYMGTIVNRATAARIFREAASLWIQPMTEEEELWAGYEQWLDEQADRREYELSVEI